MITELRTKFQEKSGHKTILWIVMIAMTIIFVPSLLKKDTGSQNVLFSVNGYEITYRDFERRVQQEAERIALFKQQLGEYGDQLLKALGFDNPKAVAFQSLTQEALLNSAADHIPVIINDEYVASLLKKTTTIVHELNDVIPLYTLDQQGAINKQALQRYLQRYNIPMAHFEHMLEEKIRRNTLIKMLDKSLYIPRWALHEAFLKEYSQKSFSIGRLNYDAYLKKVVNPSADELKAFFEQENKNTKRYWKPETRTIMLVEFDPQSYGIAVSEADQRDYYASHKSQYIESPMSIQIRRILLTTAEGTATNQELLEKARIIREQAQHDPASFAELAKKYSDDKKTKAQGGLLPFFGKGEVDPALEKAAFRLRNDNDISDVITTKQGVEIIQRVQRKPVTYKSFEDVAADIQRALTAQQFKQKFALDAQNALRSAKNEPQALTSFIQEHQGAAHTKTGITYSKDPIAHKTFALALQESGFVMNDNKGYLITVNGINPTQESSLQDKSDTVKQDYKQYKAALLIDQELKALQETAPADRAAALKKSAIKLEPLGTVSGDHKEILQKWSQDGLNVGQIASLKDQGDIAVGIDAHKNGYVVLLDQVKRPDNELFEEKKHAIRSMLYQEKKGLLDRSFVASLYRNATIKSTELLTSIQEDQLP